MSPCSGVTGAIRSFTIIVDLTGYNGSKYQTGPWPMVTAQRCDTVVVTVVNYATQPHWFAVASCLHLWGASVGGPQQTLQFQGRRIGHSRVYCTINCSVAVLMHNA